MTSIVIDSSVSLKWVLDDEIDSDKALELQKHHLAGKINLIAPSLWYYEVVNGLKNASLTKPDLKISLLEAKLNQLLKSSPALQDIYDLSPLVFKNSYRYQISAYDSAYITLAHSHKIKLVTADSKLVTKIANPRLVMGLINYH